MSHERVYSNITVHLKHDTGRTEVIENAHEVNITDGVINVTHRFMDDLYEEEYDALEWRVTDVYHTELPLV